MLGPLEIDCCISLAVSCVLPTSIFCKGGDFFFFFNSSTLSITPRLYLLLGEWY